MDSTELCLQTLDSNSGWPLEYGELARYFERASEILNGSGDFTVDAHRDDLAVEFHDDELQTTIFQMSRPRRFGQRYRTLLARSANVRVCFHGRIIEIEEDACSPTVRYFHCGLAAFVVRSGSRLNGRYRNLWLRSKWLRR